MEDERYFAHARALLTRDKGWIKPLLVMAAANMVPVAGPLGNKGYALEWARLTAWGVDASPKQKNVDVGKCIASGWRGFVVQLGWGFALGLAMSIFTGIAAIIPGALGALLGFVVSAASFVVSIAGGVVITVAQIRAAIYERIGAGYRIDRVFDMIKRDTHGFMKVFLITLACSAVLGVAGALVGIVLVLQFMPIFVAATTYSEYAVMTALANSMVWIMLTLAIFGYAFAILGAAYALLMDTVVALWMRQFDVAHWGRSEDPLPGEPQPYGDPYQQPPVNPRDGQQGGDGTHAQSYDVPAEQPYEYPVQDQPQTTAPARVETIPLVSAAKTTDELPPAREAQPQAQEQVATPVPPDPVSAALPSELDKNVDDLYADLYAVIRKNDRVEGDDSEGE